jgi:O-antigen/teichoic acid export membrane protein
MWMMLVASLWSFRTAIEPLEIALLNIAMLAIVGGGTLLTVRLMVKERFVTDRRLLREMAPYVSLIAVGLLPNIVRQRLDHLVVASIFDLTDLGFYSIAASWASLGAPVYSAFGFVVFPAIANATSRVDKARLARVGVRGSMVAACVFGGTLLVVTPIGLPLIFGKSFVPSVFVALILTVNASIAGVAQVLADCCRGLGRPGAVVRSEVIGLSATAVVLYPLTLWFGMAGVAVSSAVGSTAAAVSAAEAVLGRGLWVKVRWLREEAGTSAEPAIAVRSDMEPRDLGQ